MTLGTIFLSHQKRSLLLFGHNYIYFEVFREANIDVMKRSNFSVCTSTLRSVMSPHVYYGIYYVSISFRHESRMDFIQPGFSQRQRKKYACQICTDYEAGQSPLKQKYGLCTKNKVETNYAPRLTPTPELLWSDFSWELRDRTLFFFESHMAGEKSGEMIDTSYC